LFKLSSSPKETGKEGSKDPKQMQLNWKLRFFILVGNVLSCYTDHEHIATNKGEIFLFEDTEVLEVAERGKSHGLIVQKPFDPITMAAISVADQALWKSAFLKAVDEAKHAPKGFIVKISSTEKGAKKLRYCVLHENVISFHTVRTVFVEQDNGVLTAISLFMQSQNTQSTASSLLYLDQYVMFDANDAKQLLMLTDRVGIT
jgi:hypothetical protein